ncbi:MAG: glycosyltransferase family 1 protein [Ferruginibacter sp.]
MKKRILIDASTVTSQIDGLSHYIINLIKYLPEASFEKFEYSVVINKGLERKALTDLLTNPRIQVIEAKIASIGPRRDWDMFWFLLKYKKKFDIIHITSSNYPFALKNGICTIHDITFKKYFDNPQFTFNLAPIYMDWVVKAALRNAKAIITVSQSTKNEVVKAYKLDEKRSKKIHPVWHGGWEHLVHEIESGDDTCPDERAVGGHYLLYVGTHRKHKNISNLLLSFKYALDTIPENKKLTIIGSEKYLKPSDLAVIHDINTKGTRVIFTGYLSQACVDKYFENADAFIFPSLSEGFGLGVLEAFYYKIPLLCSNITSIPEIAGDAALYFNPFEPKDIAGVITKFYADSKIAKSLTEAGQERLKLFSWKKNAAETVAFYENCLYH